MSLNENIKYEQIDSYLDGSMSSTDLDKFKAFMQSDADLALDTKIMADIGESALFAKQADALRSSLDTIRKEDIGDKVIQKPSKGGLSKILIIGLGLLFLGLSLLYVFKSNKTASNNAIYQQYALAEPLNLTTKSAISQDLIRDLQLVYNSNDYTNALPLIEKYLSANPKDIDVLLAKAKAQAESNNYKSAHQTYDFIAQLQPRVKKHQWYKALCYLKEGRIPEAQSLLTDIVSQESFKYKQAGKILVSFK